MELMGSTAGSWLVTKRVHRKGHEGDLGFSLPYWNSCCDILSTRIDGVPVQLPVNFNTLCQMQSLILNAQNISACRDPTASPQGGHCLAEVWKNLLLFTGCIGKELTLCKSLLQENTNTVSYPELLFSQLLTKKKKLLFYEECLFVYLFFYIE